MKRILSSLFITLSFICLCPFAQSAEISASTNSLPEHPVIVCLGDSITLHGYPKALEKLLHVRVINAGVGGNTSRQGLARLKKDVLAHKPDAVVFFFGTNDTRQDSPKKVSLDEYKANLAKIIDACVAIGAKTVMGTIPPIDPKPYFERHPTANYDALGGFEHYLNEFRTAAKNLGKERNVPVIEFDTLLPKHPNWRSPDGVHPTEEGGQILAKLVAEKVKPILDVATKKK